MKEKWKRYLNTNLLERIPPTSLGFKIALISSITLTLSFFFWDYISANHEKIRNIGLVSAALIGFPMLIWRTRIADRQASTSEASHTAETYTKAIEQLGAKGADGKPSMELRLGGLYALENIARSSAKYHKQIMEVLCAYVRMYAVKPVITPSAEELREMIESGDLVLTEEGAPPRLDIQTALTIIGRRHTDFDGEMRLDLTNTKLAEFNLTGANLTGAHLTGADLSQTNFTGANLSKAQLLNASLFKANLFKANLTKANLFKANLTEAQLVQTNLTGAGLIEANFFKAILVEANLQANFYKANLIEANLYQTNLTDANLTDADLTDATLTDANLTNANLCRTIFTKASFNGVNFYQANLTGAIFTKANIVRIEPKKKYLEVKKMMQKQEQESRE